MKLLPPSDLFDLTDKDGRHSNSKMAVFIVTIFILIGWGVLKYFDKEMTWQDVALLVSLILAAGSIRALLAFWKGRASNGVNGA